ncbi:hypothetical protein [Mycolicibacter kumamotonensis]|uniref:hypothetical protein n=1 Tax=Mycolicibacter kumamotonensis TaxID=354243 RepID=UPI001041FCF1|nr:hypothetical protein [Mycolicibacter kumamotonensis]
MGRRILTAREQHELRVAISQADLDDYRWERNRQEAELENITGGHPDDIEDYFARGGKPLITFRDWISGRGGGEAERQAWEDSPDNDDAPYTPDPDAWGIDDDVPVWARTGSAIRTAGPLDWNNESDEHTERWTHPGGFRIDGPHGGPYQLWGIVDYTGAPNRPSTWAKFDNPYDNLRDAIGRVTDWEHPRPLFRRKRAANADIDSLLELLTGDTFGRPDDFEEPSPPSPPKYDPVPGVPEGWERYYHHIIDTPDSTDSAHLMMPTDQVLHYREYDRDPNDENYQTVKKVIQDHGGIRQPLILSTNDTHGLLAEGNHRAAIAKELGITHLPVKVYHDDEVQQNEGSPVAHHPDFAPWLAQNKDSLPSFWGKRHASADDFEIDPHRDNLIWDWAKGRWVPGNSDDGRIVPEVPKEMAQRSQGILDRHYDDYQRGRRGAIRTADTDDKAEIAEALAQLLNPCPEGMAFDPVHKVCVPAQTSTPAPGYSGYGACPEGGYFDPTHGVCVPYVPADPPPFYLAGAVDPSFEWGDPNDVDGQYMLPYDQNFESVEPQYPNWARPGAEDWAQQYRYDDPRAGARGIRETPTLPEGESYEEDPKFQAWFNSLPKDQVERLMSSPGDAVDAFHEAHPDYQGQPIPNDYTPRDWYNAYTDTETRDGLRRSMPQLQDTDYDDHETFQDWWNDLSEEQRNHYVDEDPHKAIDDFHQEYPVHEFPDPWSEYDDPDDPDDSIGYDPFGAPSGSGNGQWGKYYSEGPWYRTEPDGRSVETNREGMTLQEALAFNEDPDNYRNMRAPRNDRLPPMTFEPTHDGLSPGILARHAVDGRPIGELNWDEGNGHIGTLSVHPEFRGMGVNHWMLHHARSNPGQYPSQVPITHSTTLSHMGQDAAANDPVHAMLPKSAIEPFHTHMDTDDPYSAWTLPRYRPTESKGGTMYRGDDEGDISLTLSPQSHNRAFIPSGSAYTGPQPTVDPVTADWSKQQ